MKGTLTMTYQNQLVVGSIATFRCVVTGDSGAGGGAGEGGSGRAGGKEVHFVLDIAGEKVWEKVEEGETEISWELELAGEGVATLVCRTRRGRAFEFEELANVTFEVSRSDP